MSTFKLLLPLVAAARIASAQSSCSGGTTVVSQGDASAVAACQTYSGTVAVSSNAPSMLDFSGSLTHITGDLNIKNATQLNSLTAGSLQVISGTFLMNGLTTLSSLTMPELQQADINWQTLPALQGITFGSFANASNVNVQDTSLQKLDQLNVAMADSITIANNGILTSIDWQITNCTGDFSINSNNENGGLKASFPNLQGVGSMEVRNVSSIDLSSLANVNGSLAVAGSDIESLSLPNLTTAQGVAVLNCPSLSNLSAPEFATNEGSLVIVNNDKLGGVLSFPQLKTIRGAMNITGAISGLDMPKINLVAGKSTIVSSKPLGSTCEEWGPQGSLKAEGVIRSTPVCFSEAEQASGGSSSGSSGSSSSSSSSPNAAVGFDPSTAAYTGVLGVLAAMFGML